MFKQNGITLVALVITIIVMLILAGVATYSGIEAIENTKYTKFMAELKIMQTYVNDWYEDLKPDETLDAETFEAEFRKNITSKFVNEKIGLDAPNAEEDESGKATQTLEAIEETNHQDFYVLGETEKEKLGIEGVSQIVMVNVRQRKVVSYYGLKFKGNMYYTLDEANEFYNVDYKNKNTANPQISVTGRSIYNGDSAKNAKYKFTVDVTQGSKYINKGDLYYGKIENGDVKNWNKTEDKSFIVDREGTYKIYYKDAAGNESEQVEYKIEPKATLISGENLNKKMKELSGSISPTSDTANTNITEFRISAVKPDSSFLTTNNNVSTNNSMYPVYMWFDNGIIYIWSEENWINFNSSSSSLFKLLKNLNKISEIYKFDTSHVTNMSGMFNTCNNLLSLDLSNFNTSNVTNMALMFLNCNSLKYLDISSFNTKYTTTFYEMFMGCKDLIELDLSHFNTENVASMYAMFHGCSGLEKLNISNFNTKKVTNFYGMFYNCCSLLSLNLSSFNTENITIMQSMFHNCNNLTILDLSNFDTKKVSNMFRMFQNCNNLQTIYVSENFITSSLTNDKVMSGNTIIGKNNSNLFYNCPKLIGGAGTTYSSTHVDADYAHIDGSTSNPGYFTLKTNNI